MKMQPFGRAMDKSLRLSRLESEEVAIWEEEDYCSPPLAQERAAVLDHYFTSLSVERVKPEEGWARISNLPSMWEGKGASNSKSAMTNPG